MKTQSYIQLLRAIASEYVLQVVRPIATGIIVGLLVLLIAGTWLTSVNVWFWVLDGFLLVLILLLAAIVFSIMIAVRVMRPTMTPDQHTAVRTFTNKLQQTTEDIRTPWPWIAIRLARDVIFPSENSYTARLIESSKTLYPEFRSLEQSFRTPNVPSNIGE
jgi:hypothetical protein